MKYRSDGQLAEQPGRVRAPQEIRCRSYALESVRAVAMAAGTRTRNSKRWRGYSAAQRRSAQVLSIHKSHGNSLLETSGCR